MPSRSAFVCTCDWPSVCDGDGTVECVGRDDCFCLCGCRDECFGCSRCAERDDDYDDLDDEMERQAEQGDAALPPPGAH
jgi:hypothetical protein